MTIRISHAATPCLLLPGCQSQQRLAVHQLPGKVPRRGLAHYGHCHADLCMLGRRSMYIVSIAMLSMLIVNALTGARKASLGRTCHDTTLFSDSKTLAHIVLIGFVTALSFGWKWDSTLVEASCHLKE